MALMVVVHLAGVRLAVVLLAVALLVAVAVLVVGQVVGQVVGRVDHGSWRQRLGWLLCPVRAFAGVLPTGWCSRSTSGGPALCPRRALMRELSSPRASREAVEVGVLKQGGCC